MRINAAGVSAIGYRLLAIGDRQAIEKDEGDLVFFHILSL